MVTYPSTHGVFEGVDPGDLPDRARARRPGVHGRRQHERPGGALPAGRHRRRRLPSQPAQDVLHSRTAAAARAWGRSAWRRTSRRSCPAIRSWTSDHAQACGTVSAAPWGSAAHPADLLGLHRAHGLRRADRGDQDRDPQRQLHRPAARRRTIRCCTRGQHGLVAHECIIDTRPFKASAGVEVEDIAKRIIDYGFHPPTVSFPVAGHADDRADRERVEGGARPLLRRADRDPGGDPRDRGRPGRPGEQPAHQRAAHAGAGDRRRLGPALLRASGPPIPSRAVREHKVWPTVGRVDSAYGDRNLVCVCPPVEAYGVAGQPHACRPSGSTPLPRPGWHNMAIDHALLDRAAAQGEPWLRLYRWSPALSLVRPARAGRAALRPRADRGARPRRGAPAHRRPRGVARRRAHLRAWPRRPRRFGTLREAYAEIHRVLRERAPRARRAGRAGSRRAAGHRARRRRLLRRAGRRRGAGRATARWSAAPSSGRAPRCSSTAPSCSPTTRRWSRASPAATPPRRPLARRSPGCWDGRWPGRRPPRRWRGAATERWGVSCETRGRELPPASSSAPPSLPRRFRSPAGPGPAPAPA